MRTRMQAAMLAATFLAFSNPCAAESKSKPNLGRVMWAAFSCATYAEMSGDKREQERLFNIGYTAGQRFLQGIKDKTVSEADAREAPIGVLMYLGGPSIDFMIGRVFESATGGAFDAVVKTDSKGTPIHNPLEWVNDDEVKRIKAQSRFRSSNCELVQ